MIDTKRFVTVAAAALLATACAANPEPSELTLGHCNAWDTNADGFIDTVEFERGFMAVETFPEWDADDDGFLDNTEWSLMAADADYFDTWATWDRDDTGSLDESEFADGAFMAFDEDDDGVIGPSECRSGVQTF